MKRSLILAASLPALAGGAVLAQDIPPESVFAFVDANGDGSLAFAEINAANPNVTEAVFAQYDADGSGGLSLDEFRNLFANGPRPPGL